MEYHDFMRAAASVVPSPRQAAWLARGMFAFVHFTVNTYTGREWGTGDEPESIFNPVELDCGEWVRAIKAAGLGGLILTAKHHDGFCLWPSAYTEHSVKNSPWKGGRGDVVREAAEACRRGGIPFGVYLSPWDRNSPLYGTDAYNDYYCNQLTELLTGYGELFEVWFDGACGEGPNGRRQVYDFDRYIALIRRYQPNAVIFNDAGPDVRWCGNEAGQAREAEWAVVPSELCFRAEVQTGPGPDADRASLKGIYNSDADIGTLPQILASRALVFAPSEFDMSIRPGWFYHENEAPHPVERLMRAYLNSVGGGGCLNLNIPPMPSGRFDPRDVARLAEFRRALDDAFGAPIPAAIDRCDLSETQCTLTLTLPEARRVRYLVLAEDLSVGQRVERFVVRNGSRVLYRGTTIGHRRICPLPDGVSCGALTVTITAARATPAIREASVY